jgi:hypothetical protein
VQRYVALQEAGGGDPLVRAVAPRPKLIDVFLPQGGDPDRDQAMSTLIACLDATLRRIGEVPAYLLGDSAKTVTVGAHRCVAGAPPYRGRGRARLRRHGLFVSSRSTPDSKGRRRGNGAHLAAPTWLATPGECCSAGLGGVRPSLVPVEGSGRPDTLPRPRFA